MPDEIKTDPDWPTPKVKQEIKTEPCEKNSNTCFPVEFVENQLPAKTGLGWKSAEAAFEQLMIEKPWEHDDEVCDETLIPAPKSYLSKPKQGERSPRQCWLRLRRSWLKKKFYASHDRSWKYPIQEYYLLITLPSSNHPMGLSSTLLAML